MNRKYTAHSEQLRAVTYGQAEKKRACMLGLVERRDTRPSSAASSKNDLSAVVLLSVTRKKFSLAGAKSSKPTAAAVHQTRCKGTDHNKLVCASQDGQGTYSFEGGCIHVVTLRANCHERSDQGRPRKVDQEDFGSEPSAICMQFG